MHGPKASAKYVLLLMCLSEASQLALYHRAPGQTVEKSEKRQCRPLSVRFAGGRPQGLLLNPLNRSAFRILLLLTRMLRPPDEDGRMIPRRLSANDDVSAPLAALDS
jgi:hypothetical protein